MNSMFSSSNSLPEVNFCLLLQHKVGLLGPTNVVIQYLNSTKFASQWIISNEQRTNSFHSTPYHCVIIS